MGRNPKNNDWRPLSSAIVSMMMMMLLLWACCCCNVVDSAPYILLTSTRSRCMSVIAPQGQTIVVKYHAPDMKMFEDNNDEGGGGATEKEQANADAKKLSEAAEAGAEGLDTEWNKRMKEKLERMKDKKMRDMSITMTQKSGLTTGALAGRKRRTSDGEVTASGRVREELTLREGTIKFQTLEEDGTVDICVQSIVASRNTPSRVSLNVTMMATDEEDAQTEEKEQRERDLANGTGPDDSTNALGTMSRLERDLSTLQNRVRAILNNADFVKDQEAAFHEQSVSMNKAALYWPIIQLVVVLVTGFTQVNHIVRFMKNRHIGI